ncbi:MAG: hypothetical protein MUC92_05360 [Fimbriimonadaceae bacterium]|jgi:diadenosine tetraphosphate (Ap4A) HIT family hydrolase|nr:hypothetical protein [Fimbriimonadaceae bacterium]
MTQIHRFVETLRLGNDPKMVARMGSGWAVMGSQQVVGGYCLLLPDPVVPHLNALGERDRVQFLGDMSRLGDAILEVTGAERINYEMLGNLEPALHCHLFPRRLDEPESLRTRPIWFYEWDLAEAWSEESHGSLRDAIRETLARNGASEHL